MSRPNTMSTMVEAEPEATKLARVFVSSTFADMKRERDILARRVFPRVRDALEKRSVSLFEVDLRWGITREEAENGRAVLLCLREIDDCWPLFVCMLGERYGWRPRAADVEGLASPGIDPAESLQPSVTELEVRRAFERSQSTSGAVAPVILMRDAKLSRTLGHEPDHPDAMNALKAYVRRECGDSVLDYSDFDAFEAKADRALKDLVDRWVRAGGRDSRRAVYTDVERPEVSRSLARACASGTPTILTGNHGSGSSWLAARWLNEMSDRGRYPTVAIDGRATRRGGIVSELRAAMTKLGLGTDGAPEVLDSLDDAVHDLVAGVERSPVKQLGVLIDHFEDAYAAERRADVSGLPRKLPRSLRLLIVSKSERLVTTGNDMGFQVVRAPEMDRSHAADFARAYLKPYGKRLTDAQADRVARAAFSSRIGALVLCLDELRRYGEFHRLDARVAELAAASSDDDVARSVLSGLRSELSGRFTTALDDILVALSMTLSGLRESELSSMVSRLAGENVPPQVWSTIRVGLGRSLVWRGARIDIADGPVRRAGERVARSDEPRARAVGTALLSELDKTDPDRWLEESPNLAYRLDGEAGLEMLLRDRRYAHQLTRLGRIYASGNLEQLDRTAQRRVLDAWCEQIEAEGVGGDDAWELGYLAAQLGALEHARRLWDLDARSGAKRPDRDLIEVVVFKNSAPVASIGSLQSRIPPLLPRGRPRSSSEAAMVARVWRQAASVLGAAAEGLIQLAVEREKAWSALAVDSAAKLRDGAAMSQARLLIGQLELGRARWRQAERAFADAAKHARACGHAKRLVQALERGAVAALERNAFSRARKLGAECLDVSRECHLDEQECFAFERLIEVERRRANWSEAFELVTAYLERAGQLGVGVERAQACLDSLEL